MRDSIIRDEAIRAIHPEVITINDGKDAWDKDGNNVILNEVKILEEINAQAYARNRASAFPSIGDQLDMQYHDQLDGTTTWKDAVAKVKSDNPKE
jgi:hypothetical protein